jgi:hypothetical protein
MRSVDQLVADELEDEDDVGKLVPGTVDLLLDFHELVPAGGLPAPLPFIYRSLCSRVAI